VDESRHPRYRDNEDSRFYKTDRLSLEETWRALRDELGRVLMNAQRAFWRGRLEMNPERVRWWHGAIFAGRAFRQPIPTAGATITGWFAHSKVSPIFVWPEQAASMSRPVGLYSQGSLPRERQPFR
jgi:hypothetical protein